MAVADEGEVETPTVLAHISTACIRFGTHTGRRVSRLSPLARSPRARQTDIWIRHSIEEKGRNDRPAAVAYDVLYDWTHTRYSSRERKCGVPAPGRTIDIQNEIA